MTLTTCPSVDDLVDAPRAKAGYLLLRGALLAVAEDVDTTEDVEAILRRRVAVADELLVTTATDKGWSSRRMVEWAATPVAEYFGRWALAHDGTIADGAVVAEALGFFWGGAWLGS